MSKKNSNLIFVHKKKLIKTLKLRSTFKGFCWLKAFKIASCNYKELKIISKLSGYISPVLFKEVYETVRFSVIRKSCGFSSKNHLVSDFKYKNDMDFFLNSILDNDFIGSLDKISATVQSNVQRVHIDKMIQERVSKALQLENLEYPWATTSDQTRLIESTLNVKLSSQRTLSHDHPVSAFFRQRLRSKIIDMIPAGSKVLVIQGKNHWEKKLIEKKNCTVYFSNTYNESKDLIRFNEITHCPHDVNCVIMDENLMYFNLEEITWLFQTFKKVKLVFCPFIHPIESSFGFKSSFYPLLYEFEVSDGVLNYAPDGNFADSYYQNIERSTNWLKTSQINVIKGKTTLSYSVTKLNSYLSHHLLLITKKRFHDDSNRKVIFNFPKKILLPKIFKRFQKDIIVNKLVFQRSLEHALSLIDPTQEKIFIKIRTYVSEIREDNKTGDLIYMSHVILLLSYQIKFPNLDLSYVKLDSTLLGACFESIKKTLNFLGDGFKAKWYENYLTMANCNDFRLELTQSTFCFDSSKTNFVPIQIKPTFDYISEIGPKALKKTVATFNNSPLIAELRENLNLENALFNKIINKGRDSLARFLTRFPKLIPYVPEDCDPENLIISTGNVQLDPVRAEKYLRAEEKSTVYLQVAQNKDVDLKLFRSIAEKDDRVVEINIIAGCPGSMKSQTILRLCKENPHDFLIVVATEALMLDWTKKMPEAVKRNKGLVQTYHNGLFGEKKTNIVFDDATLLPPGYFDAFLANCPSNTKVYLTFDPRQSTYYSVDVNQNELNLMTPLVDQLIIDFDKPIFYSILTYRMPTSHALALGMITPKIKMGACEKIESLKEIEDDIKTLSHLVLFPSRRDVKSSGLETARTYKSSQGATVNISVVNLTRAVTNMHSRDVFTALTRHTDMIFFSAPKNEKHFKLCAEIHDELLAFYTFTEDSWMTVPNLTDLYMSAIKSYSSKFEPSVAYENVVPDPIDADGELSNPFERAMNNPEVQILVQKHNTSDYVLKRFTQISRTIDDHISGILTSIGNKDSIKLVDNFMANLHLNDEFNYSVWNKSLNSKFVTKIQKPTAVLKNLIVSGNLGDGIDEIPSWFLKSQFLSKQPAVLKNVVKKGHKIQAVTDIINAMEGVIFNYIIFTIEQSIKKNNLPIKIYVRDNDTSLHSFFLKHWDFSETSTSIDTTNFDENVGRYCSAALLTLLRRMGIPDEFLEFFILILTEYSKKGYHGNTTGQPGIFAINTIENLMVYFTHLNQNCPIAICSDDLVVNKIIPNINKNHEILKQMTFDCGKFPEFCSKRIAESGVFVLPLAVAAKAETLKLAENDGLTSKCISYCDAFKNNFKDEFKEICSSQFEIDANNYGLSILVETTQKQINENKINLTQIPVDLLYLFKEHLEKPIVQKPKPMPQLSSNSGYVTKKKLLSPLDFETLKEFQVQRLDPTNKIRYEIWLESVEKMARVEFEIAKDEQDNKGFFIETYKKIKKFLTSKFFFLKQQGENLLKKFFFTQTDVTDVGSICCPKTTLILMFDFLKKMVKGFFQQAKILAEFILISLNINLKPKMSQPKEVKVKPSVIPKVITKKPLKSEKAPEVPKKKVINPRPTIIKPQPIKLQPLLHITQVENFSTTETGSDSDDESNSDDFDTEIFQDDFKYVTSCLNGEAEPFCYISNLFIQNESRSPSQVDDTNRTTCNYESKLIHDRRFTCLLGRKNIITSDRPLTEVEYERSKNFKIRQEKAKKLLSIKKNVVKRFWFLTDIIGVFSVGLCHYVKGIFNKDHPYGPGGCFVRSLIDNGFTIEEISKSFKRLKLNNRSHFNSVTMTKVFFDLDIQAEIEVINHKFVVNENGLKKAFFVVCSGHICAKTSFDAFITRRQAHKDHWSKKCGLVVNWLKASKVKGLFSICQIIKNFLNWFKNLFSVSLSNDETIDSDSDFAVVDSDFFAEVKSDVQQDITNFFEKRQKLKEMQLYNEEDHFPIEQEQSLDLNEEEFLTVDDNSGEIFNEALFEHQKVTNEEELKLYAKNITNDQWNLLKKFYEPIVAEIDERMSQVHDSSVDIVFDAVEKFGSTKAELLEFQYLKHYIENELDSNGLCTTLRSFCSFIKTKITSLKNFFEKVIINFLNILIHDNGDKVEFPNYYFTDRYIQDLLNNSETFLDYLDAKILERDGVSFNRVDEVIMNDFCLGCEQPVNICFCCSKGLINSLIKKFCSFVCGFDMFSISILGYFKIGIIVSMTGLKGFLVLIPTVLCLGFLFPVTLIGFLLLKYTFTF